jgi:hypothetical protein
LAASGPQKAQTKESGMKEKGWTGLPRGRALWETPELRASALAKRFKPLPDRLAKYAPPLGQDDCWEWSGARNNKNYGVLRVAGKNRLATHIALEVDGRPRPDASLFALHRCDNPPCVNPNHLRWGTQAANMQEALSKGRNASQREAAHPGTVITVWPPKVRKKRKSAKRKAA